MEDAGAAVRMAGYLEKRGKLKLMSNWKKYWFVLEGQLLLYYKSQEEYKTLSVCRGSLNIGIASCVRPGQGLTIQVVTRTQCVTLKTKERALQEQWLQALLDSMALPNTSSLKRQSTGTQHFRYSLDNLPAIHEDGESSSKGHDKKSTLPRRVTRRDSIVHRLKKMGGVSYGNQLDSTPLKTHRLEFLHKKLSKSSSTSMIETDLASLQDANIEEKSSQSMETNETFQKNLYAVHNCLQETANDQLSKSVEESKNDTTSQDYNNEDNQATMPPMVIEINAEYLSHSPMQDKNQNYCLVSETNLFDETINESNYCYESLKTIEQRSQDQGEKVDYIGYDTVELVPSSLQDEEEPDLPPRPVHEATKIDFDQGSEYEEVSLVECESVKKPSSDKKHSHFRDLILLKDFRHQKLFRKSSKDKIVEESEVKTTVKKKKRKPSFLKKFGLKHKKEASQAGNEVPLAKDEELEDEEPDYEYVCCQQMQSMQTDEGFSLQALMPADTMSELKNRLANDQDSDEDSVDYETIGSATTDDRPPSLGEKSLDGDANNTRPPLLATSTEHLYAKSYKSRTNNSLTLVIPSLPPRRTNRPPSPWHDVPTNNSPVCEAPLGILLQSNVNPDDTTSPHKEVANSQIVPDEILNTPQGFLAIQNRWRQVEKSGEWNREHQQVAFPNQSKTSCESHLNQDTEQQNIPDLKHNIINEHIENDDNEPDSLEKDVSDYPKSDRNEEMEQCDDTLRIQIDTSVEVRKHIIMEPSEDETCDLVDLSTHNSQDVPRHSVHRYSDELHLLLAQLAEITSAPLFQIGATKSLLMPAMTTHVLDMELGPIRRRRHSEPDYDVPRPHGPWNGDAPDTSMSPDSLEPQLCVMDNF